MAWSTVMIFDLIVVVMTLIRTIQINRRSGKDHILTRALMRDGKIISWNAFGWLLSSSSRCRLLRVHLVSLVQVFKEAQKWRAELLALRRCPTLSHLWCVHLASLWGHVADISEARICEPQPWRLRLDSDVTFKEITRGTATTITNMYAHD